MSMFSTRCCIAALLVCVVAAATSPAVTSQQSRALRKLWPKGMSPSEVAAAAERIRSSRKPKFRPPPLPLLAELAQANLDYFGNARVYRYPDAPGQTKEELVACYRASMQKCGPGQAEACDPDDDAAPAGPGHSYLPQDLAELFMLTTGNVADITDPTIDFYVLNPFLVLSHAVGLCNGMNHTQRLAYWVHTLRTSPATHQGRMINRRHVFVSVSWTNFKLVWNPPGKELQAYIGSMTYLLNEDNTHWAAVKYNHPGKILVVPYLAHRYIESHAFDRQWDAARRKVITFIGSLRSNAYRMAADKLYNESWAQVGVDASFTQAGGNKHRWAAWNYSDSLQTSTFCLHIPGDTVTSRRFFDAILAGCVPVIVTGIGRKVTYASLQAAKDPAKQKPKLPPGIPDPYGHDEAGANLRREQTMHNLPFQGVVPYSRFSIVVDGEDWLANPTRIAQSIIDMPPRLVHKLQRNLARWREYFDYRSRSGTLNKVVVELIVNDTREVPRPTTRRAGAGGGGRAR